MEYNLYKEYNVLNYSDFVTSSCTVPDFLKFDAVNYQTHRKTVWGIVEPRNIEALSKTLLVLLIVLQTIRE